MIYIKILRRIGGTVIFTVGMIAVIFPVIPGWPLLVVGLYVLSIDSPNMQVRVRNLRLRYERVDNFLSTFDRFLGHDPRDKI